MKILEALISILSPPRETQINYLPEETYVKLPTLRYPASITNLVHDILKITVSEALEEDCRIEYFVEYLGTMHDLWLRFPKERLLERIGSDFRRLAAAVVKFIVGNMNFELKRLEAGSVYQQVDVSQVVVEFFQSGISNGVEVDFFNGSCVVSIEKDGYEGVMRLVKGWQMAMEKMYPDDRK